MLKDRLLSLLSTGSPAHVHVHLPLRAGLHLLLLGVAAVGAILTAQLVSDAQPSLLPGIPPAPLSGVRAIAPSGETFLRPGVSHTTDESPLRASLPTQPSDNVPTDDTPFTRIVDEVADAEGCGRRALTEQIDPREPYVLYTIRPGDTLGHIAEACGSTVQNILLNNAEVDDAGFIPVGLQILVPLIREPIETGILYKVGHGETLGAIIDDYLNVTVEDVIAYRPNGLSSATDIQPGDYVLLPNAEPKPPPIVSPEGHVIGPPPPVSPGRFGLPLANWNLVSDTFGTPRGAGRIHTGIDLALGGYPASSVYASCDGWVSRTEWLTYSYGYYVIVDCGDGWKTLYAHFREITVSWGQSVAKGETLLGISGSTGFSTGEHLHFEIQYNGQYLDPAGYLDFY